MCGKVWHSKPTAHKSKKDCLMSQQINFFCHNQLVRSAPGPCFFFFFSWLPPQTSSSAKSFQLLPTHYLRNHSWFGTSQPLCDNSVGSPRKTGAIWEIFLSHNRRHRAPLHFFLFSILRHSLFINPVFLFTRNCQQDTLSLREYSFSFGSNY